MITINHQQTPIQSGETLYETAKRAGYEIPTLCYAKGYQHKSSCMVCAVKNLATGQMIPSCTTYPEDGMMIETESPEVRSIRKMSLELLLSDHRADCEAPCSLVCPKGLDVERMLSFYDSGHYNESYQILSETFSLPTLDCDTCKAPCEKACRRGTVDKAVSIREIIRQIAGMTAQKVEALPRCKIEKNNFQSRLGRLTESERERLKTTVTTSSRCLHCACDGKNDCKLRVYATLEGVKRPHYDPSSALPAMFKQHVKDNIWFEPAKCIRCGLCVYNSANGFTFKDRGFAMQVILPDENREHISEEVVELCPTGAIYVK